MSAAYPPTARQLDLLRFVRGYQDAKGCTPTFDEIRAALGLRYDSGVQRLIAGLEVRGHLRRRPRRARSIELLSTPPIPRAPDGAPLFVVAGPWSAHS